MMTDWMFAAHDLGVASLWWLFEASLWTGAVFLVVRGLDHLLRSKVSAAWRIALYGAVLVRLALPLDWTSMVGALPATQSESTQMVVLAPVMAPAAPVDPGLPWGLAALAVYGLVALALAAHRLIAHLHLRGSLVGAQPDRVFGHDILVHDELGPLTFGVVRPRVVVPRSMLNKPSVLGPVLRHEQAHVLRRDPLLAEAMHWVCVALWPMVPAWLAARRVRVLIEHAADEHALAGATGLDARQYGMALIEVATGRAPTTTLGAGGHLKDRLKALGRRSYLPRIAQIAAVAGLGVVVTLLAARQASGSARPGDEGLTAEQWDALRNAMRQQEEAREQVRDALERPVLADDLEARIVEELDLSGIEDEVFEALAEELDFGALGGERFHFQVDDGEGSRVLLFADGEGAVLHLQDAEEGVVFGLNNDRIYWVDEAGPQTLDLRDIARDAEREARRAQREEVRRVQRRDHERYAREVAARAEEHARMAEERAHLHAESAQRRAEELARHAELRARETEQKRRLLEQAARQQERTRRDPSGDREEVVIELREVLRDQQDVLDDTRRELDEARRQLEELRRQLQSE